VSVKALAGVLTKIGNRCSPSLIQLYTAGYDPSEEAVTLTPGMDVLEQLRLGNV
jgi:hypothetical protein